MEGVESKTLALLTHLGKPFSCFDFLAAIEHPVLKYHRASDAGCSVCWGPWGMPGARGARGAEQRSVLRMVSHCNEWFCAVLAIFVCSEALWSF